MDNTLIDVAATGDARKVAKLLSSEGVRVDARDDEGYTALLSAAQKGHKEMCELLVDIGKADIEDIALFYNLGFSYSEIVS